MIGIGAAAVGLEHAVRAQPARRRDPLLEHIIKEQRRLAVRIARRGLNRDRFRGVISTTRLLAITTRTGRYDALVRSGLGRVVRRQGRAAVIHGMTFDAPWRIKRELDALGLNTSPIRPDNPEQGLTRLLVAPGIADQLDRLASVSEQLYADVEELLAGARVELGASVRAVQNPVYCQTLETHIKTLEISTAATCFAAAFVPALVPICAGLALALFLNQQEWQATCGNQ